MRLVLTKGFNGEEVELIAEGNDMYDINSKKFKFLRNKENKKRFKIEKFETHTKKGMNTIIDFGDYSYFMRLEA